MEIADADDLSYADFCARFLATNTPVKLRNVTRQWFAPAVAQWTTTTDAHAAESDAVERSSENGSAINFAALKALYGDTIVPVVDGDVVEYGAERRVTMRFDEYLELLETKQAGKRYLKDWHFVHAFRHLPPVYTTPVFFQDDWLNWWWDHQEQQSDDYRFVYIGPAGSWTPMHHDVFRSYSWSVNITGCKEWIFFHPDEEWKLKDRFGRYVVPDVTADDLDTEQFPHVHEARAIRVVQRAGEAIFVPSGWYHQVKNLDDTISINHNWFNGFSLQHIWAFFQRELAAVERELADLQELGLVGAAFRDQCQLVMRANTGINYVEFRDLLRAKVQDLLAQRRDGTASDEQLQHVATIASVLRELATHLQDGSDCDSAQQMNNMPSVETQLEQLE